MFLHLKHIKFFGVQLFEKKPFFDHHILVHGITTSRLMDNTPTLEDILKFSNAVPFAWTWNSLCALNVDKSEKSYTLLLHQKTALVPYNFPKKSVFHSTLTHAAGTNSDCHLLGEDSSNRISIKHNSPYGSFARLLRVHLLLNPLPPRSKNSHVRPIIDLKFTRHRRRIDGRRAHRHRLRGREK